MRNEQIKRMAAMMAEYNKLQEKESELQKEINRLESLKRSYKTARAHKGDLLAKLGGVTTKGTHYEYQCKVKALIDSDNNKIAWRARE